MPLMPLSKTRVVDPVLTNLSQGYSNTEFVGKYLFPLVPVTLYGGKIITFDKSTRKPKNFTRAPGAVYRQVHRSYDSNLAYSLELKGAEFPVPFEHVADATQLGFQWDTIANDTMMEELGLELEVEQATLATSAANYDTANKLTLSGTDQWSDPDSTPGADIKEAKSILRRATGKPGNTLLLGSDVFDRLTEHPAVIDRFKHTSKDSVTADMLAALWELDKVVVGQSIQEDATGADVDIWGKFAILAYTNPAALATGRLNGFQTGGNVNKFQVSFGYTYTMQGHPYQKPVFTDEKVDAYLYQTKFDRVPLLTNMDAGFLFSAAVA